MQLPALRYAQQGKYLAPARNARPGTERVVNGNPAARNTKRNVMWLRNCLFNEPHVSQVDYHGEVLVRSFASVNEQSILPRSRCSGANAICETKSTRARSESAGRDQNNR